MNFLSKICVFCLLTCMLFAQSAVAREKEKQQKALLDAVRSGNEASIQKHLADGVSLDETFLFAFRFYGPEVPNLLKSLLDLGAHVNYSNSYGKTPLMAAASSGVDKVKVLLEHGAQVNVLDKNGYSPLLYALSDRHLKKNMLKLLLEKGADVNIQDPFGYTPLMATVLRYDDIKDEEVFDMLLNQTNNIEVKNRFGETALFIAARQNRDFPFQKLLAKGADIRAQDKDGTTVLMVAAADGEFEKVQTLLAKGAHVHTRDNEGKTALMHIMFGRFNDVRYVSLFHNAGLDINAKDMQGNTALYYAAAEGLEKIVKALLDVGANIASTNTAGKTALDIAIEKSFTARDNDAHKRYVAIAKLLDPSGAKLSQAQADHIKKRKKTKHFSDEDVQKFLTAAKQGDIATVKAFLDAGMSVDAGLYGGQRALVLSIVHGRPQIVQLLLDKGADVTRTYDEMRIYAMGAGRDVAAEMSTRKKDFDKVLLLMQTHPAAYGLLVKDDNRDFVKKFIASGADVNFKDKYGRTPLMLSILASNWFAFEQLLANGADVNIQDMKGNTALIYVAQLNNSSGTSISHILAKNPDVTLENRQKRTALFYAKKEARYNYRYDYGMYNMGALIRLEDYIASLPKEKAADPKNTLNQEKPAVQPSPMPEKAQASPQALTSSHVQQSTIQTALDAAGATPPAPKKPGIAVILPTTQDIVGLQSFEADTTPDNHIRVVAQSPSPLIGVLVQNINGKAGSWKTKQAKGKAQGVLLVQQNGKTLNAQDAPFSLVVTQPVVLDLFMQDNGAIAHAQTRMRVIFFHEDGSRLYAVIQR